MSMEWDIAGGGTMAPRPARDWDLVAYRQGRYYAENARRKIIILSIKIKLNNVENYAMDFHSFG